MSSEHLNEHELTGYLDGDLSPVEMRRVRQHLHACERCRGEVDAVTHLLRTSPLEDARATAAPLSSRRRAWAGAATLAAAGLAAVLLMRPSPAPVELQRAEPQPSATEGLASLATYVPQDASQVERAQLNFAWSAIDAESYRITLTDEDGALLWSDVVGDTAAVPPADLVLPTNRRLYWYVDAIGAGIVARSAAHSFMVAP